MQKISFEPAIEKIVTDDPRYPKDAYEFVRQALDFTIKKLKKNAPNKEQHITGKELLDGMREYALQQFGPLSYTVLKYWNLQKTEDVGDIVFNMVKMQVLKKTERDSHEDFKDGYNFEEVFRRPFEPSYPTLKRLTNLPAKISSDKLS